MEDLLLEIDNIDYKATANNVKNFLENKLPCILRLANSSPASLASPVISDMPVNRGGGNHSEEKMVKYVAARAIIDGVSRAIAHCSQASSHILKALYVQGLQNWQVIDTMY